MPKFSYDVYVMRDDIADEYFLPSFAPNAGVMKRDLKNAIAKNPSYPVDDFSIAYIGNYSRLTTDWTASLGPHNWVKLTDFLKETVKDDEEK